MLISPLDEQEAREVIAGGADIIDVKNPKEGSLGANFPWIIKAIRAATPNNLEVSCTIGDVPNLPGTAALAALGAASTGVNYVKASLYNLKTQEEAADLMRSVSKAVKDYDSTIKVVAVGFADAHRIGSVNPLLVPQIAQTAACDVAMLDTAVKDGKTLLDFLSTKQLAGFVAEAHGFGLQAALAGSLRKEHLPALCGLGADIVGLRGAACNSGDRLNGRITQQNVAALVQALKKAQPASEGF